MTMGVYCKHLMGIIIPRDSLPRQEDSVWSLEDKDFAHEARNLMQIFIM